jgi:hypothetical protein
VQVTVVAAAVAVAVAVAPGCSRWICLTIMWSFHHATVVMKVADGAYAADPWWLRRIRGSLFSYRTRAHNGAKRAVGAGGCQRDREP